MDSVINTKRACLPLLAILLLVLSNVVYNFSGTNPIRVSHVSRVSLPLSTPPHDLTFDAGQCAAIIFNGTTYIFGWNGTASYPEGIYRAFWDFSYIYDSWGFCPDWISNEWYAGVFETWNASGGLIVQNTTSNPTNVTVTGPGTLWAEYRLVPPSSLSTASLIIMLSIVWLSTVGFAEKRRNHTRP